MPKAFGLQIDIKYMDSTDDNKSFLIQWVSIFNPVEM